MREVKIGDYYELSKSTLRIENIRDNYYWYRNITFNHTSRISINFFETEYLKGEIRYSVKNSKLWRVINK